MKKKVIKHVLKAFGKGTTDPKVRQKKAMALWKRADDRTDFPEDYFKKGKS